MRRDAMKTHRQVDGSMTNIEAAVSTLAFAAGMKNT
jgi:hypothetical protein